MTSTTGCGYPLLRDSDNVIVTDYVTPAVEGTSVTFECPPRYVLIGPNGTICTTNGEWKPDPREVECRSMASYIIHVLDSSPLSLCSQATPVFSMLHLTHNNIIIQKNQLMICNTY